RAPDPAHRGFIRAANRYISTTSARWPARAASRAVERREDVSQRLRRPGFARALLARLPAARTRFNRCNLVVAATRRVEVDRLAEQRRADAAVMPVDIAVCLHRAV